MKDNIYTSGGDIVKVFYVRENDLLRDLLGELKKEFLGDGK